MIKQIIAHKYLVIIFLIAIGVRFLFFPNNIYFGYDQARDAYEVKKILSGDFLLGGPTTLIPGLSHGVLYYYIYAPFYFLAQGDPTLVAILHRIVNALGVILIFYLSSKLFNKKIAIIAAIIFTFSFEQTQFALYINHPSFGILSVKLMYLGFILTIFKKKKYGLILVALGLGLSIQFEFVLTYLIAPFILISAIYYKTILKLPKKILLISFLTLILCVSTFIMYEIKFNFKTVKPLLGLLQSNGPSASGNLIENFVFTSNTLDSLNFTGGYGAQNIYWKNANLIFTILIFIAFLFFLYKDKENREKLFVLGVWFFSLIFTHIIARGVPLQYHNVGASISLIIFMAYLIDKLFKKNLIKVFLVLIIVLLNLNLIYKFNPNGTIPEIHVQQKMLLSDQKKILDIIYKDANGEPFAAKALTMPFAINTTWSYLYQWYGKQKYGYEPIWGDKNAIGYEGGLRVNDAQHQLPPRRYLVVEPLRGIHPHIVNDYLRIEGYFTKVEWEKEIGQFKVQKRYAY